VPVTPLVPLNLRFPCHCELVMTSRPSGALVIFTGPACGTPHHPFTDPYLRIQPGPGGRNRYTC
jgi:hypothetical protein